ncbi:MAG: flagellar basal body-associated FliL family protein [Planctomycetaceae bacterium]|nr:flagellar basal body-associated FliL family protein [Planctomycetaceae bacterium]
MSDHKKEEHPPAEGQDKPSGGSIVPWIAVGVISAGLGTAVPFLLSSQSHAATGEKEEGGESAEHGTATEGDSHKSTKRVKAFELPKEEETVFLPFGEPDKDQEVVVNLDEGRMSRYLRIAITMQIPKSKEEDLKKRVDAKKIVLRNWLLSKISDLNLDDIRGAAGQNRLRREIRDYFNSVLCPDGYDQIYDVLFEEFNVQ